MYMYIHVCTNTLQYVFPNCLYSAQNSRLRGVRIDRVLDYVTQHFDNPTNTYENKEIIALLFTRCFAHILHHHFPDFIKHGYEHLLINCLKRFCYFVERFSLSTVDDFEPIKKWFEHHKERDQRLHMLKYELL